MQRINLNIVRHTQRYELMLAFYAESLGLPVDESWDEGMQNRGTVFQVTGGGTFEVLQLDNLAQPPATPINLEVTIRVDDAQAWHDHLSAKGVPIARGIEDAPWHHRSFGVDDPDGLRIWFVEFLDHNP